MYNKHNSGYMLTSTIEKFCKRDKIVSTVQVTKWRQVKFNLLNATL